MAGQIAGASGAAVPDNLLQRILGISEGEAIATVFARAVEQRGSVPRTANPETLTGN